MCVFLIFILSLICCLFSTVSSSIWIFTMPSTASYARFEQNVLGFHCTIDAKTILWRTTSFLPIFRLRRNRERLQDRATGTERTNRRHRYSSQLQCFLLQRIQRNRALAVRQFDVVKVEKMSRKIKPWTRRYRCVSGLLCRFLRSILLRICCEGGRGKLW